MGSVRLWALIRKELRQIARNRRLVASLIIPPTVLLVVFGFALSATVTHLRMGVVDESNTHASRDLVSAFTANETFSATRSFGSVSEAEHALSTGDVRAVLVIPTDFDRLRMRGERPQIQLLVDATNANTAAIVQGYSNQIVQSLNAESAPPPRVKTSVALFYNPGLVSSWFIITGVFGVLLINVGSLIAAQTTIREKEVGTLEQLLMTPADTSEIVIAKIAPLFVLLMIDVFLIIGMGWLVFGLAVKGPFILIVVAGALCVLVGISVGTFIATFSQSALQAQLMSFFVNPPLSLLSGATTPVEAMPHWLQPLTLLNPVRHFSVIARGVMIKGSGLDVLYPHFLALAAFTLILVFVSMRRFRSQLA